MNIPGNNLRSRSEINNWVIGYRIFIFIRFQLDLEPHRAFLAEIECGATCRNANICSEGNERSPVTAKCRNSLFKLVVRTRTRLATDPRDMIYGLVALASDTDPLPFAPTCEIAVNHLYEEFAAHVIRQNKNLDIFGCCTFQPGLKECASWVPDWRYSEEFATFINPEKDSFHAAGTSCWDTSTAIVNHSLGVEAISLDRLQNITFPEPMPKPLRLLD